MTHCGSVKISCRYHSNTVCTRQRHSPLQDTIEEWLEKADYDSDGRISLEEFKMGIAGNKLIGESLDIDVY